MRVVTILAVNLVVNGEIFPLETTEDQMEVLNNDISARTKFDYDIDTEKYKDDLIRDFWMMKRNFKVDETDQRKVLFKHHAEWVKDMEEKILFETALADFMRNLPNKKNSQG